MLCARRGVEKASRPPSPMLQCMKQSWTSRESVILNTNCGKWHQQDQKSEHQVARAVQHSFWNNIIIQLRVMESDWALGVA